MHSERMTGRAGIMQGLLGRVLTCLLLATLAAAPMRPARAQEPALDYTPPATTADPALAPGIRDLAVRLLPVYQDSDRVRYLDNLSVLQIATRNWPSAWDQRQSLLERRGATHTHDDALDLYVRARLLEYEQGVPFAQAWARMFRTTVRRLSDKDALDLERWLQDPTYEYRNALQRQLDLRHGQSRFSVESGLQLVRAWVLFDAWRNFSLLVPALVAEDQGSRYQQEDVQIRLTNGRMLPAHLVLPRAAPARLPAQLQFRAPDAAPAPDGDLALAAAGNAVVTVVAPLPTNRRGQRRRAAQVAAVAHWIAHQPWSNGHVQR